MEDSAEDVGELEYGRSDSCWGDGSRGGRSVAERLSLVGMDDMIADLAKSFWDLLLAGGSHVIPATRRQIRRLMVVLLQIDRIDREQRKGKIEFDGRRDTVATATHGFAKGFERHCGCYIVRSGARMSFNRRTKQAMAPRVIADNIRVSKRIGRCTM